MLVPQLYESVMSIIDSAPEYYQSLEKWAVNVLEDNPEIRTYVERALNTMQSYVENWVKTSFLSDVQKILATLTTSVMAVVKSITNFIIGLVASIYILWSKDTFQAQAKKMVVAACKPEAANHLLDLGSRHQPDFLGLYHRQDHRLCDHRRLVLHLHDAHEDAVYGADCDDCRRDERHSGVRSVHRRGAECADHSAGRPAAGVLLHHLHHCSAAGGRQRHSVPRSSATPSASLASGCSFRSRLRQASSASRGCCWACRYLR